MNEINLEILKAKARLKYPKKSMLVAYILWFVLGSFAGHRFYLHHYKMAIFMLLCWPLALITSGVSLCIALIIYLYDIYNTSTMVNDYNSTQERLYVKQLEKAAKKESLQG